MIASTPTLTGATQGAEFDKLGKVAGCGRRHRVCYCLIVTDVQTAFKTIDAFRGHPKEGFLLTFVDLIDRPPF